MSSGEQSQDTMTLSPGVTAMLILLPATMFHLLLAARSVPARLLALPAYLPGLEELWSSQALLLLFIWLSLQVALYLLPARKVCVCSVLMHQGGGCREGWTRGKASVSLIKPALYPQVAEGLELKDKSRLRYPINGAWGFPSSLTRSYTGWGGFQG